MKLTCRKGEFFYGPTRTQNKILLPQTYMSFETKITRRITTKIIAVAAMAAMVFNLFLPWGFAAAEKKESLVSYTPQSVSSVRVETTSEELGWVSDSLQQSGQNIPLALPSSGNPLLLVRQDAQTSTGSASSSDNDILIFSGETEPADLTTAEDSGVILPGQQASEGTATSGSNSVVSTTENIPAESQEGEPVEQGQRSEPVSSSSPAQLNSGEVETLQGIINENITAPYLEFSNFASQTGDDAFLSGSLSSLNLKIILSGQSVTGSKISVDYKIATGTWENVGSLSLVSTGGEERELAIGLPTELEKHLEVLSIRLTYSYPKGETIAASAPLLSIASLKTDAVYEHPVEQEFTDTDLLALSQKLANPESFESLQFSTKNVSLALPGDLTNPLTIQSPRAKLPLRMLFVGASTLSLSEREGRTVHYPDAYPKTDVDYEITEKGFKESIVLSGAGHPSSFRYYANLGDFDVVQPVPNRVVLYEKGHLGQPLFQRYILSAPFMEDSNGRKSEQVVLEVKGNILTLIPNEEFLSNAVYPVIVDPTVEISVLDVYSHPVQGDTWGIDFATIGTENLSIEPADELTRQDMQFQSLSCDSVPSEPAVALNGTVSFPAWTCDGVGRVEFEVLRTGDHNFTFTFGEETAQAHNSAMVWSGAAGDGLWSTASNWSSSDLNVRVPQAGDSVTFDNTCTNCNVTIDVPVTVTSISLASSYAGTVTQATGADLTLAGNYTHAGGTFAGGAASMTVEGNFAQAGGSFTAPASLNSQGSFAHTGGTFLHNNGTVNLTGTAQGISGSSVFYNLAKSISSADTVTFAASSTQTVANNFTFQGAGTALLALRSSVPGSRWNIEVQGSSTLAYLDVRDSNNLSVAAMDATGTGSVNSGNNVNWNFDIGYSQTSYRFYENTDLLQPAVAVGGLNSTTTITATDTPVRLRMNVRVENQPLASSTVSFRLQVTTDVNGQWLNVGGGTTSGFWYNQAWPYRKQLSFNNGSVDENLDNFPMLVTLTPNNFDYAKAKADGGDLRFTDADGLSLLEYEVESWNRNATSTLWVKVPRVSSSSTSDSMYLYYGNSGASGNATTTGVWSGKYTSVWHLKESSGSFSNSAGQNILIPQDTVARGISGIGGNGVSLEDSSAHMSSGWEQGTTSFTEEIWFKTTTTWGGKIIGFGSSQTGPSSGYDRHTYMENSGRLSFGNWVDTPRIARSDLSYNDGEWHYLVGSIGADGTNLYVDGALVGYDSNTRADSYGGYWRVGYDNLNYWPNAPSSYHFSGLVDEVRISNSTYSPAWVKAQYDSMSGSFLDFGSEESQNTGEWSLYDNASLDATSVLTGLLLPTSNSYGLYSETALAGTNPTSAAVGDYMEYDWSLNPSSMLSATYYYFRMVASDGSAFQSYNVYPAIVRATSQQPDSPSNLGPAAFASGAWASTTAPTLSFSISDPDVLDQVKYGIQIDDNADFSSPLVDYTSALGSQGSRSFTVGQDAGGGTYAAGSAGQILSESTSGYYWRVLAKDGLDLSSGYTVANAGQPAFKVDSVAPVVEGFSLTPTATTVLVSLTGSTDATSGLNNNPYIFSNLTAGTNSAAIGFTSWTSTLLSPNVRYSFSVMANDLAGNKGTATGSVYTLAAIPTSTSATALSITSIKTSWNGNSNASGTEYFVENVTTATSSGWTTLTAYDFSGLTCGTTYTFRVKARNGDGTETSFTPAFQGTTSACNVAPNVPASFNISSGAWLNDSTPTFSFVLSDNNAGQPVRYRIQVDDDADFSSPLVDYTSALGSQGSRSFTVGQDAGGGTYAAGSQNQALADTSYYWQVRAIDDSGSQSAFVAANSGNIAFKLDTVPPTAGSVSFASVTPQSITVLLDGASDGGSGLAGIPYLFSNVTNSTNSSATTSLSWTSQGLLRNSSYSFTVTVTDLAGNSTVTSPQSTTTPEGLAAVTTGSVSSVSGNEATANGTISAIGAYPVSSYGFVWATTTNPYLPNMNMVQENTGGTPGANSENRGAAENAFDNDLATFWGSDQGFPYDVEYAFPSQTVVNKYQVVASPENANTDSPFSWIFQAWDGTQWVNLQTITAQSGWLNNESRSYLVENYAPYSKYRLHITANGNGGWTRFSELRLMNTNSYLNDLGSASQTGQFTSSLTGLVSMSRYYVRSYAITDYGVAYGETREFSAGGVNAMPSSPSSLGPSQFVTNLWTRNSQPVLAFTITDPDTDQLLQYVIQIDNDSDFASPVVDFISIPLLQGQGSFTIGQAQGGGTYTQGAADQVLPDSTAYYWRIKAIDSSGAESVFVAANSGSIAFKLDTTPPNPGSTGSIDKSSTSIHVMSFGESDAYSGVNENGYRYYNLTTGESTGASGLWWENTGLLPNRAYDYIVVVADTAGNTATTATSTIYTYAAVPGSVSVTSTTTSSAIVSWSPNGNPAGTEYYVENIGSEVNSGWIQATSYVFSGLSCSNNFTFRVRARNYESDASGYSESVSPAVYPCNHAPNDPVNLSHSTGGWMNDSTPRFNFDLYDADSSDLVRYQIQVDDAEDFSSPSVDYISALDSQGMAYFLVGQDTLGGTYNIGSPGQQLADSYTGYYWRVRATDAGGKTGNYTAANNGSVAFKLDTIAPEFGNLEATAVGTNSITLLLTGAHDSESGLSVTPYDFWSDYPGHYSGWIGSAAWTDDSLQPGTYYNYHVVIADAAGNVTSTPEISVTTKPGGGGGGGGAVQPQVQPRVLVNMGESLTTTEYVTLQLTGQTGTSEMEISNFDGFTGAVREPYQTTKSWNLCSGKPTCTSGNYWVNVRYYMNGQPYATVADSIWLQKAPSSATTTNPQTGTSTLPSDSQKPDTSTTTPTTEPDKQGGDKETTKPAKPSGQGGSETQTGTGQAGGNPTGGSTGTSTTTQPAGDTGGSPTGGDSGGNSETPGEGATPGDSTVGKAIETITNGSNTIIDTVTGVTDVIVGTVTGVATSVAETIKGVVTETLPVALVTAGNTINDTAKTVSGKLSDAATVSWDVMVEHTESIEPVNGVAALAVAPSVMVMQYSVVTNGLMYGFQTFYDLWLALAALLNGLLARLGIRTRRRYWGVVYDSETKQPLDPAIVELVDARTGRKVESCITNLEGEYGFLDKPGEYYIRVTRSHYVFPSSHVAGSSDGLYEKVYHGERLVIRESVDLIAPNIPMDPVEFDWNQSAKRDLVKVHPKLEAFVTNVLEFVFYVGFVFTFLVLLANTNLPNFVFFCIYVVMALLRYLIPSARLYGRLVAMGRPTEGLLIELSHEKIQTIVIAKTLVKSGGKFFLRIPAGTYVMKVKDVKDDTVETLLTKTIEVGKERVLNKIIRID